MSGVSSIRKVLMTADTVGGVWTYSLDLARAFAERGTAVALATMGAPLSDHQALEAAAIPGLRIFESTYKLEWMSDPWSDVARAGDWLLTLENELSPDIIHLNGYTHADLPWRAPCMVVAHSCVLSWWQAVKGEPAPREWRTYHSAVARGLQAADVVVAPTRAMLTELQRHYGHLRSTAVVPNGRAHEHYRTAPKEPLILAAGRVWDEAKNIAQLAQVRRALDWPIYVAGDPRHPDGRENVDNRNLRLLGTLSSADLAGWFSRAAIYCLPARYEPFGLSVLEAALSGCALVLGDIPSLRENWDRAAVFVHPDDSAELEWQLRALTSSPHQRDALAARASHRAQSFTAARTAASYLSLYSHLARNSIPAAVAGD